MRILYIDPESFEEHLNYNKLQVNALYKLTSDVSFFFRKGYANNMGISSNYINIPNYLYHTSSNSLINRLLMLCRYWYILFRMIRNFYKYDAIIISYYDQIPFYFAQLFPKKTYLINHINIAEIYRNRFKRYLFKQISRKYNQIVMDEMSRDYLKSIGINNVFIVRHGIIEPYQPNLNYKESNIIFCPSNTSVDRQMIQSIISDSEIIAFLKMNNYKLVIKGDYVTSSDDVIIIVNRFLNIVEYNNLILKCKVLLLPYSENFIFRSSGVLFEGIANNKIIAARAIPSLMQYKKFYNNLYGFIDVEDFKTLLNKLFCYNIKQDTDKYIMMPDYSFLNNI